MVDWVLDMVEVYGYVGVFFMMAIENIFPPIPSEVILLFGGFMTTYTNLTVIGVIMTSTTGSIIGAIILYGIGFMLHLERLEFVVDRWGSVLRLTKEDLWKANSWFEKYGYWAVLFGRMIPLVRSLISIPAGMSKMTFWLFLLFTIIGTVVWNTILVSTGVILGASWQEIIRFLEIYAYIVYVFIGLGIILFGFIYLKRHSKQ